jgi:hypothetical protein
MVVQVRGGSVLDVPAGGFSRHAARADELAEKVDRWMSQPKLAQ